MVNKYFNHNFKNTVVPKKRNTFDNISKRRNALVQSKRSSNNKLLMALKRNVFNHEKKFIDVNIGSGYITSGAATIVLINGVTQGPDETQRIGRQTNMKSIFIRGSVSSAATTSGSGLIRTIIVMDQEVPVASGTGQVMVITDFLVSDSLNALNNLNYRKRFKILWDDVQPFAGISSATATQSVGTPNSCEIYKYISLDETCEFNAQNNGSIADFTKNALYFISYTTNLTTAAPIVQVNTRVRFTDN